MPDSTSRFSNRVQDYIRYRPTYPKAITDLLRTEAELTPQSVIADIGSGTGFSSLLFLENGHTVYGVEPNGPMRLAAEKMLAGYASFKSIDGTAEYTTLPDASVDVVFCAQAFHWFDREKTKTEFSRILRNNGGTVLVWNERDNQDPFTRAYGEAMAVLIPDFTNTHRQEISDDEIRAFFTPNDMRKFVLKNQQELDLPGLKGRLLSSSYVPQSGPVYDALMEAMDALFDAFASNALVTMVYETRIYMRF
ncbi:MAG: class I SAM-dependent methyltransferase [Saprospiraceae bacterium]|nr:class I SAM-dependent methyltransferase [Saprospiraceae bacterium]